MSSKLQFIHVTFLEYLTAFYPLLLVLLTWICIELQGRNFKPLVWIWRPFHKYFVRLRRDWNTTSDLVDVFASFFLLSYGRILFQSILLINCRPNYYYSDSQENKSIARSASSAYYDPSMPCNSPNHVGVALLAAVTTCLFNIIPALLLVLYPIKVLRVCLSKCRLECIVVNTFANKFHGCYRDGLDGGRDMRSLSGLYLLSRVLLIGMHPALLRSFSISTWFSYSILFLVTTLLIAYLKPYKVSYMNVLDVTILMALTLLCLLLSVDPFRAQGTVVYIVTLIPAGVLVLFIISKNVFSRVLSQTVVKQEVAVLCCKCLKKQSIAIDSAEDDLLRMTDSNEPVHQPITSTVVSLREL